MDNIAAYTPKSPKIDSEVVHMMPQDILGKLGKICIYAKEKSRIVISGSGVRFLTYWIAMLKGHNRGLHGVVASKERLG